MPFEWSDEKLRALEPARLEVVREHAAGRKDAVLLDRITTIQQSRRRQVSAVSDSPVIGFHFKCRDDYEVTLLPDGTFWSGVWVVARAHCEPAKELGGYVALHSAKKLPSYRQGTILDWKLEDRTKGKTEIGVSFLLRPFDEPVGWYGNGSGERGYRRVDDEPRWTNKAAL